MGKDGKFQSLLGKKINKLTVMELDEVKTKNNKNGSKYWWCECDCGKRTTRSISTSDLNSNNTKSCGLCITFQDWCTENNRQDILYRWNYELNDHSPDEISYKSGKKYYFKCLENKEHKDELRRVDVITVNKDYQIICTECNSFAQWGIDNLGDDFLEKYWDYDKNTLNPWEISYKNNKHIWIKCVEVDYHESYNCRPVTFVNGHRCSYCTHSTGKAHPKDSFAQWCIDNIDKEFMTKYWSDRNTLNPFEFSYSSTIRIWIKCQEKDYHEDYETMCSNFVKGRRCPFCINKKVHPKDSLGQYITDNFEQYFLQKIWGDKNEKSSFEYSPYNKDIVWWKCIDGIHDDYQRGINGSNIIDFRCTECVQERTESFLQEKVRSYLESLNYIILHENKCTIVPINPKTNYKLPFDNEIKELKLIIEVNGQQHYKVMGFHKTQSKHNKTTPEQEFYYQQLKDRYKRIKAIQQGYYYLEIPYWADDKKETWKQLIDNKLKLIQENAKLNQAI